jgi:RNA polymerase primary sigma factor
MQSMAPTDGLAGLDRYLADLGAYPLLTAAEEQATARRAAEGDSEALARLVGANLRFVVSEAKQWRGRGLALDDLIAEGNLGLWTAARKFDPEQGVKFITYAVHWVRQAIRMAIAEQGHPFRVPVNQGTAANRLAAAANRLRADLHREPTDGELADEAQLTAHQIKGLGGIRQAMLRIGDAADDGKPLDVADATADTAQLAMEHDRTEHVAKALQALSPRQALVVRLSYGLDGQNEHTLEEIGKKLGVTRERVRQIRQDALAALRGNATLAEEAGARLPTSKQIHRHKHYDRSPRRAPRVRGMNVSAA